MAEFTASEDSLHSQGGGLGRSFPGVDHVRFQPCFDTRCMQGWDLVFLSARSSIHNGFISEIGLQEPERTSIPFIPRELEVDG